ncbi:hypothetical protein CHS0354_021880 [Potamilus streckersoni]|uniref:Uncharacterized protein n=1 Tax=Potamilus streckersoni TaxID=2493646 RepID=A0AAE0WEV5_9BIVA|nr:hypothetical protein CHS0354_021880 [Potamilus streckersoni]
MLKRRAATTSRFSFRLLPVYLYRRLCRSKVPVFSDKKAQTSGHHEQLRGKCYQNSSGKVILMKIKEVNVLKNRGLR